LNAREWLDRGTAQGLPDLAVLGAPIHRASISLTSAHTTPPAIRAALERFSTWDGDHNVQLEGLRVVDLGDVEGDDADPDATAAHGRIEAAVADAFKRAPVVAVLGGDNSLTRPAMAGAARSGLGEGWGLLTLDAHHDCRPLDDGASNGTPVRGLITDGLPGSRVAQIGIRGFANHEDHAAWALAQGIDVRTADEVRAEGMAATLHHALADLRAEGVTDIYADIDIDVLDRAFAPACPASLPGGLRPPDALEAAYLLGADPAVRAVDFVEVDAAADVAGITLRVTASVFLAFCAGLTKRLRA
jgi:formiminoglutamase